MRYETPSAAGDKHIQDRVDDQPMSELQRPFTPGWVAYRQVNWDCLPHRIGQGTRIGSAGVIPASIDVVHKHAILAGMTPR